MARFNTATKTGVRSPIKSATIEANHQGGLGYAREAKSELFLLAVANFVGKDTFYEDAQSRDDRFSKLSAKVAVADPIWFYKFVGWLRNDSFMRTAAVVAAVEGAKALHDARGSVNVDQTPRLIVGASMARADEPGEVLGYYGSKYGSNYPAFLKKAVADGANKLFNEYSLLKYDSENKGGFRFADILQLTHPAANSVQQNALFKFILDSRYGNVEEIPDALNMLQQRAYLMGLSVKDRRATLSINAAAVANGAPDVFKQAGMTWEALSGWLQGPMDAKAWESIIPNMGYMALLRNLRNFSDAGVSDSVKDEVSRRLEDPAQVAKSKQFPFRFLAAYQANKDSLDWGKTLERALQASLTNVPSLPGSTLILVDRSGSMFGGYYGSDSKELDNADKAAIFGSALALRAKDATLVQYGSDSANVPFRKGEAVLTMLNKFRGMGGTNTAQAIRNHFSGHDRVVLITDEQSSYWGGNPGDALPKSTPLYTWNLVGYGVGEFSGSQKRHTFGGLTDKAFVQIPMIEAGQQAKWPWEVK